MSKYPSKWSQEELWAGVPKTVPFYPDGSPNALDPQKYEAVKKLLIGRMSIREVSYRTNVSNNTILRIRSEVYIEQGITLCGCGELFDHEGWCSVKFAHAARLSVEATTRILSAITKSSAFFTFEQLCRDVGCSAHADRRIVRRVLQELGSENKSTFERDKVLAPIRRSLDRDENEIDLLTLKRHFESFDEPVYEGTPKHERFSDQGLSPDEVLMLREDEESEEAQWERKMDKYYQFSETRHEPFKHQPFAEILT